MELKNRTQNSRPVTFFVSYSNMLHIKIVNPIKKEKNI
jgi:hypothetical protein